MTEGMKPSGWKKYERVIMLQRSIAEYQRLDALVAFVGSNDFKLNVIIDSSTLKSFKTVAKDARISEEALTEEQRRDYSPGWCTIQGIIGGAIDERLREARKKAKEELVRAGLMDEHGNWTDHEVADV